MKKQGFTLIEVLVSIGLFAVIVAIAIGGLARALRAQRQVASLLAASSNVSLVLEQMAREMRNGFDFFCDRNDPLAPCARIVNEVSFTNSSGEVVTYCLENGVVERGVDLGLGVPCGGGRFDPITGGNVAVRYLEFLLLGNGNDVRSNPDGFPPRITIAIGVSPKEATISDRVLSLQTTVSSRLLDE